LLNIKKNKIFGKSIFFRIDVIILLAFLFLSIILIVYNYHNSPRLIVNSIGQSKTELKEVNYTSGYDIVNSVYTPIHGDPQISYTGIEEEISCMKISFRSKLRQRTLIQIYYRNGSEELSESKSVIFWMPKGVSSWVIILPRGKYAELRVDINGIFESPVIEVSNEHNSEYKTVKDGIFYIIFFDFIFIILWFCLTKLGKTNIIYQYIFDTCLKLLKYKFMILIFLFGIIFISFGFLIGSMTNASSILFRCFFALSILFATIVIIFFNGKPEKLFLTASLIVGFLLSVTLPLSLISWDEETHYSLAVEQSFFKTVYFTSAENDIRSINIEDWFNSGTSRSIVSGEKNFQYRNGFDRFYSKNFKSYLKLYSRLGHIPSGIMLFLARSFKFSFQLYFFFGRMGNVLVYSFVIYLALKRLKTGKYILSTIALFPTCVFLASNYSYDYWVTAFTALGVAYLLRELQEPDRKIEIKNICIMIGAFVVGLGPKPIYFPLMIMLYFLRKEKFTNKNIYRKYLLFLTLIILTVVMSLVIPFLYSKGTYYTDVRGGSGVNTVGQIKFILFHPFKYIMILLKFLKDYFSLENISNYTVFFAYLGHIPNFLLLFTIIIFVTITDRNGYDKDVLDPGVRLFFLSIAFFSIALAATTLYIAFTPVSVNTIAGCQPRYIMPVLFPVLSVLGSSKIKNRMYEELYSMFIFSSLSYVLFFGIWEAVISKYN
jgi:uncharacterized membrane protein